MNLVDGKGNSVHELPNQADSKSLLKKYLELIVATDPSMNEVTGQCQVDINRVYQARNDLVEYCVILAKQCGYKAGFAVHQPIEQLLPELEGYSCPQFGGRVMPLYKKDSKPEWDTRWGVVAYIELPTGQITWHLDSGDFKWDNHSNDQKRDRVVSFIKE